MKTILKINASVRYQDSISRQLVDAIADKIKASSDHIIERDLNQGIHFVSEASLNAVSTETRDRDDEQQELATLADAMIEELLQADTIVLGVPIYNFGPPASLKAWADLVARAGTTFKYSEKGPVGLLENKKVYLVAVSGSTVVDSEIDFMTPWLRFFLGFIGITEIELIVADEVFSEEGANKIKVAHQAIKALTA
ncbi:MAG: NAD(P)H-dependent oxidoreductase [Arenicellales bacterium]